MSDIYHLSSTSFRLLFQSTFWSSIDHQWINFAKWNSLDVIVDQKRHLSTIFPSFWKVLISYKEEISSSRSKRNENETKSECRMRTIDDLKHSVISNWRGRENHFSITKRRIIENFLKNPILLSSSLATTRWKGEK
jgi:hypothetical protein